MKSVPGNSEALKVSSGIFPVCSSLCLISPESDQSNQAMFTLPFSHPLLLSLSLFLSLYLSGYHVAAGLSQHFIEDSFHFSALGWTMTNDPP